MFNNWGGDGLGFELCKEFLSNGFYVIVLDIKGENLIP